MSAETSGGAGAWRTAAPAKINLTLNVLGRRADGYHELRSLVCFADLGDELSLRPGTVPGLSVDGPFADQLSDYSNLVLDAAELYARKVTGSVSGHFHLIKNLPVASGIGGGSADAAAALRLLDHANGGKAGDRLHGFAAEIGSDVPACIDSAVCWLGGRGETLHPLPSFPPFDAVLINPGVPVSTAAVFKELAAPAFVTAEPPAPRTLDSLDDVLSLLRAKPNDLEDPACRIAPAIADGLRTLQASSDCLFARMSGSGATVFGLYPDCDSARLAARRIDASNVGRWVRVVKLGCQDPAVINAPG